MGEQAKVTVEAAQQAAHQLNARLTDSKDGKPKALSDLAEQNTKLKNSKLDLEVVQWIKYLATTQLKLERAKALNGQGQRQKDEKALLVLEVKKHEAQLALAKANRNFFSAEKDKIPMAVVELEMRQIDLKILEARYNHLCHCYLANFGRGSAAPPAADTAELEMRLDAMKVVMQALVAAEAAEVAKAIADTAVGVEATKLATATKKAGDLEAENNKAWYTNVWDFVTRPKTLWNEARKNSANGEMIDADAGESLGVFGTIKHIFWPKSTGAKVAYAAGAATVAATVVGGLKYAEHRENERTSDSRKKLALAAAAGVAATGAAAYGVHKGWEAYQTQQEPDEYLAEAGELQTPEKENSQAVGAGSSTKKSGKTTKAKGSNWMIWAFVIVLGLAAIGGYYFLFMNEEGYMYPVPEGMDQV